MQKIYTKRVSKVRTLVICMILNPDEIWHHFHRKCKVVCTLGKKCLFFGKNRDMTILIEKELPV